MAGTAAGDVPFAPGATASPGVSSAWGMGAGSGGGAAATATLSPSPENTPMLNAISIATITAPTAAAIQARLDERSAEHTSDLQSLLLCSYAVFCMQPKTYP